jgi:hypothetical protein
VQTACLKLTKLINIRQVFGQKRSRLRPSLGLLDQRTSLAGVVKAAVPAFIPMEVLLVKWVRLTA